MQREVCCKGWCLTRAARLCVPACLPAWLQGNAGACQQLLARGSSLNAADPALYQARGIVEKEARRYEAARSLFKQGLGVDSRHLHLWQVRGQQGGSPLLLGCGRLQRLLRLCSSVGGSATGQP